VTTISMSGLDAAAGVAGLLTLTFSCITALTLLSKARSFTRDVTGVRLMIELERHRLQTFAEEAGIFESRLLIQERDQPLAGAILCHLKELLSDVEKLKAKYHLELHETSEEIRDLDDENSTLARLAPEQRKRLSAIFKRRTHPWKIFKWLAVDDRNVRRLLDDVRDFIAHLERFLEHSHRVRLDHAFNAVLRSTVAGTKNQQELDVLGHGRSESFSRGAVAAAARWRQQGLRLGVLDSPIDDILPPFDSNNGSLRGGRVWREVTAMASTTTASSPTSGRSMRLTSAKLTLPDPQSRSARHFGWYESGEGNLEPVLLEWKTGRGRIKIQHLESRVDRVSAFLHELDPTLFHSLSCRGYIKDWEAKDRYAYVFDLPFKVFPPTVLQSAVRQHMDLPALPRMRTLRDLLDLRTDLPALNVRLRHAICLLESLLQLHTAGWLHKELRSENVIFIQPPGVDLQTDQDILLSPMYIAGYVHARLDNPQELTEPTESGFENDLYRHPQSMGNSKLPYRKSFDIFSVGCVLLELGLWISLRDLLHDAAWRSRRRDSHQEVGPVGAARAARVVWASSPDPILTPRGSGVSLAASHEDLLRNRNSFHVDPRRSWLSFVSDRSQDDSIDLLELRYQLLLSDGHGANSTGTTGDVGGRAGIFRTLEGTMGTKYTSIVKQFLEVDKSLPDEEARDAHSYGHEGALALEIEALGTLRTMAQAI
jgi:hypothetical protein